MRLYALLLVTCFGVSLIACGDKQPAAPAQEVQLPPLPYDRELYALAQNGAFSGSVLVALPDTVFEQSYRLEGAPERMHTASNRRYPIGEVAQLFVRAAYFRLADQGRFNLNENVSSLVPELQGLRYAGQAVTINYRMLLDHRSGLPQVLPKGQALSDVQLISQPGIEEHYTPLGYELLARALSERLGQPIEDLIRVNVLEPATMSNTATFYHKDGDFPNRAVGFTDATGTLAEVPLQAFGESGLVGGVPEYYSTITDLFYLAQWMPESAYLKGKLVQPAVRPGYRAFFEAQADGSKVAVVLSNFGGADMQAARAIVRE